MSDKFIAAKKHKSLYLLIRIGWVKGPHVQMNDIWVKNHQVTEGYVNLYFWSLKN